jgi:hypothetical protein
VAKILICANKLQTCDLIYLHVLINMPCVVQKTLPYMPRGRNMIIASTLIYIYIVSPKWCDKSATYQAVKTPYMPNGRKLALSSSLIYI